MELYQLRSFVTIAAEGNLTRAARRLHASQAAVSGQLKALEEELGLKLFERTSRGMRLNEAGKRLRERAERVLDAARELTEEAKELRRELRGVMRVALNTDASIMRVDRLVAVLARTHPGLGLHLLYCDSLYTVERLRAGEMDLGFAVGHQDAPDLSSLPLPPAAVYITGPIKWREKLENAAPQELAAYPWLGTSPDCPFEQAGMEFFASCGETPVTSIAADDESITRTLMLAGEGLTMLLEEDALRLEREGLAFIWRGDRDFRLPYSLYWLKKRDKDPAIRAVRDAVAEVWGVRSE